MRPLGFILAACVALALLKAVMAALVLALALALVWGCLFRPAQAFGLIGALTLAAVIQVHPWAAVAFVGLGVLAGRHGRTD